jgi:hypothetical protein
MKRCLWILLLTGCTATRLTHYRGGFGSCHAADPNVIECGGKQMAKVECYDPGDEACGALAIVYADGERIFLHRPPGFDSKKPEPDALEDRSVLRPELSSDAQYIWFKPATGHRDMWVVYEPQTGITREVDGFQIFEIRQKDPHSMPLWVANVPK